MGNETGKMKFKGIIADNKAVEVNDFWTLYNAESPTTSNEEDGSCQLLSIFQGESAAPGQLWSGGPGPMERSIKNLMVYRHPYILKYVATWEQSGQKYLATERVSPLSEVINQQSSIQICLGLRAILSSLIFLVEKAQARHLNICLHSIFVSNSGSWRLGGFSYVWKAEELTKYVLKEACSLIDRNSSGDNFEQFAFATMCEQVLSSSYTNGGDGTPHVYEFKEYCSTHLKHKNSELRPQLSAVLLHPYFNHEFVLIHSFLFELPLKSLAERQKFFITLIDRLRCFEEKTVASQLGKNLLTRMVLLDPTAQQAVIPHLLRTKTTDNGTLSLFSPQIYVKYLLPHLLKMFRLRDAQIRIILLDYFTDYIRVLSDEQLQREILPHLRLGMNDTNDILVAKTVRCMADLVPILGATKVLGGDRQRYFSDGRPNAAMPSKNQNFSEPRSITPLMNINYADENEFMVSGSPLTDKNPALFRRLSPDGGEDDNYISNSNEKSIETDPETKLDNSPLENEKAKFNLDEEEVWSDWDINEIHQSHENQIQKDPPKENLSSNMECSNPSGQTQSSLYGQMFDDLSVLDIQVQSKPDLVGSALGEFDYFKDMEPIIETRVNNNDAVDLIQIDSSRFAAMGIPLNDLNEESDHGWGHNMQDEDDVVLNRIFPTGIR
ncbi:hypothetical protein KR018_011106 [Drosophila ironensis]|nr:hypothetical protein KR018_011106 [Drosophila ironensis]